MKNRAATGLNTPAGKRKFKIAVLLAGVALAGCVILIAIMSPAPKTERPPLVIRVDDIQDYAFREAQIFLLNESMINGVPLSLSVIPRSFGADREVVQAVKLSLGQGAEATAHGWMHEDFSQFTLEEQMSLLTQARERLKEILDYDVHVMVPPMFQFNEDTILAMQETGYDLISSSTLYTEPGMLSKILSLPGTVDLSDYSSANQTWSLKSIDSLREEARVSVQKYGFAVMVTHPQEFLRDGELDEARIETFRALLKILTDEYTFKTLGQLGASWPVR